jgi:hypothetical protein
MDDTQRNLLGGFGIALMLGGIAWLGYFPSASLWVRVTPAVAMVILGAVLFILAFRGRDAGLMSRRRGKQHLKRKPSQPAAQSLPSGPRSSFLHFGKGARIQGLTVERNIAIGTDEFISAEDDVSITDSGVRDNLHIPPPPEDPTEDEEP